MTRTPGHLTRMQEDLGYDTAEQTVVVVDSSRQFYTAKEHAVCAVLYLDLKSSAFSMCVHFVKDLRASYICFETS